MSYDEQSSQSESDEESPVTQEEPKIVYTKDYDLHARRLPTVERIIKEVEMPPAEPLADSVFWTSPGVPNVNAIRDHLKREGRLSLPQAHQLIDKAYEVFCAEDNVLAVPAPVTVCGDIHGQFFDLLKLFEVGGDPSTTSYLFLGDYVDRGNFSVECCFLLFCYKILYPRTFFMLRGNHECRHLTDYFTFKEEVEYKYDLSIYNELMDVCDALPLAAIMNKQFFCVHGGLSPDFTSIEALQQLDRFTEPPPSGLMCDLLWADPMEDFSPDVEELFEFNQVRGCSSSFSFNATCKFLDDHKLLSVIRAHEAQDAGYRMHRKNDKTGFPSVITIFSAPNYLDSYNNKAAILRYENNVINIRQFNQSPHPYYLPGFMDVFTWSMPFVVEKVAELLLVVLNLVNDAEAEEEERITRIAAEEKIRKREAIKDKVRGVSKMLRMFKSIRQEREALMKVGAVSAHGDALPATLQQAATPDAIEGKIRTSLASFEGTKSVDIINERRPVGIDKALAQARETAETPDALKRRVSREHIRRASSDKSLKAALDAAREKEEKERKEKEAAAATVPAIAQ